jgi:hypothetical protein
MGSWVQSCDHKLQGQCCRNLQHNKVALLIVLEDSYKVGVVTLGLRIGASWQFFKGGWKVLRWQPGGIFPYNLVKEPKREVQPSECTFCN